MKTLLALATFLAATNASAMMPTQVSQTLNDRAVLDALAEQYMTNIEDAPTPRCAGCFAFRITAEDANRTQSVYEAEGVDLGGHFQVSVRKIE